MTQSRVRVRADEFTVTMECGATSSCLTFDVADIDEVVELLLAARDAARRRPAIDRRVRLCGETSTRVVRIEHQPARGGWQVLDPFGVGIVTDDPVAALYRYASFLQRVLDDPDYDALDDATLEVCRWEIARADEDAQRIARRRSV